VNIASFQISHQLYYFPEFNGMVLNENGFMVSEKKVHNLFYSFIECILPKVILDLYLSKGSYM
jgi:hypothetical protein